MSVNPQLENGYVRVANEIWDEIIRRDFSKRQKDILQFILRLSYGCGRKTAYIPLLKDFALCGISPTQITNELKHLQNMKVISWDRESMLFAFNKNYGIWQVTPVKWWDGERFAELLHINIKDKTSQNMNFTKHELHEKRSFDFIKSEVENDEIPCVARAEDVSKDSIYISTTTTEPRTLIEVIQTVYRQLSPTGMMLGFIDKYRNKGFTETFMCEVLLEAAESSNNGLPSIRYIESIAERWERDGIYTRVEQKRRRDAEKPQLRIVPPKKQEPDTPEARRNKALQEWMNAGGDPNEFRFDASNS